MLGRILGNVERVVDDALGYPMMDEDGGGEQEIVPVEGGSNSDGVSR